MAIEALGILPTFENALLRPGGTLSSVGVYSGHLQIPLDALGAGLADHKIVTTLCPGGKERMRQLMLLHVLIVGLIAPTKPGLLRLPPAAGGRIFLNRPGSFTHALTGVANNRRVLRFSTPFRQVARWAVFRAGFRGSLECARSGSRRAWGGGTPGACSAR